MWMLGLFIVQIIHSSSSVHIKESVRSHHRVRDGSFWSFKSRVYISHRQQQDVVTSQRLQPHVMTSSSPWLRMRVRRATFRIGMLTNAHDVSKDSNAINKAISKGGLLEQAGFLSDGKYADKTNVRFYRCFKSFRSLLNQLKQAYESHGLESSNVTNHNESRHIHLYSHQRFGDEGESTKETGDRVVNNRTTLNPMKTVSELFLDAAGNEELIDWLTEQVLHDIDEREALWDCKARVIVQYRCCWESTLFKTLTHWGEVYVLVG